MTNDRTSSSAWQPRSVRAGAWTITALSDGEFRLDGGAMWGVVPATLWREWTEPASDNTILLALRPFLATDGEHVVVLEPGIGQRWEEKWKRIYRMRATQTLVSSLAACGIEPGDVTHVVATHCHWDHIGAQVVERDGRLAPLFPRARHLAPAIELAQRPGHARAGSYRAEDVAPIVAAGLYEGVEGTRELLPGLRLHVLGGHSDGVSVVTFDEGGEGSETAIFWSDVVPTTHHIQPAYIMAYDLDVARSFDVRSQWLARAADGGWNGLFYHDAEHAFARVTRSGRRYECTPL
jgi:glyoxylase-like metal-dependent hydrolase (beta-lactamase superfamily II)